MSASSLNVRVYSLPDCPKCDKLKGWLKERGVEFEAKWFDTEAQTEFVMRNMFGNPPILEVGDRAEPAETLFEGEALIEAKVMEVLNIG